MRDLRSLIGSGIAGLMVIIMEQIWGFAEINGDRRYVRHVVVRKGDDWKQARLVYDYQGYDLVFITIETNRRC